VAVRCSGAFIAGQRCELKKRGVREVLFVRVVCQLDFALPQFTTQATQSKRTSAVRQVGRTRRRKGVSLCNVK
jgi:hypothetical protein